MNWFLSNHFTVSLFDFCDA